MYVAVHVAMPMVLAKYVAMHDAKSVAMNIAMPMIVVIITIIIKTTSSSSCSSSTIPTGCAVVDDATRFARQQMQNYKIAMLCWLLITKVS